MKPIVMKQKQWTIMRFYNASLNKLTPHSLQQDNIHADIFKAIMTTLGPPIRYKLFAFSCT